MRRPLWSALVLVILCTGLPARAEQTSDLRLASVQNEPTHRLAEQILRRAYARAGIGMTFVRLPLRRALDNSARGNFDGEVARLPVIEDQHTSLIRVPVPLFSIKAYAFAQHPIPEIRSWADLKGHHIGIELGVVLTDQRTQGLERSVAPNIHELVMTLKRGGTDAIVYIGLRNLLAPPYDLRYRSAELESDNLYHYLHVSHRDMVIPIVMALEAMQKNGETARIIAAFDPEAPDTKN